MIQMLASVANLAEAKTVADLGADILDLKNPNEGALGAWPLDEVITAVDSLKGHLLSATIGDLPMHPVLIVDAVRAMASSGVDYVKLGFFEGEAWEPVLTALKSEDLGSVRLVAVLFADHPFDLDLVRELRTFGFSGVMLDTADKSRGSLRRWRSTKFLETFVLEARAHSLFCGLAGSLTLEDIEPLSRCAPDYLGFRGALCTGGRNHALDGSRLKTIQAEMARVTDCRSS